MKNEQESEPRSFEVQGYGNGRKYNIAHIWLRWDNVARLVVPEDREVLERVFCNLSNGRASNYEER